MPEQQPSQVLELPNREVSIRARLSAFHADYTDTNVRLLNHIYIVGPVSNRQGRDLRSILSNQFNQLCFLRRRCPIDD